MSPQRVAAGLAGMFQGVRRAVQTLEVGLSDVGRDLQTLPTVRAASQGLAAIGTRVRSALGELADPFGSEHSLIWGAMEEEVVAGLERRERSFPALFVKYGGVNDLEMLEDLANDCSRTCNRSRAYLDPRDQQALLAALEELAPVFDMLETPAEEGSGVEPLDPSQQQQQEEEGQAPPAVQQQQEEGDRIMQLLAARAKALASVRQRAEEATTEAVSALTMLINSHAPPGQQQQCQEEEEEGEIQPARPVPLPPPPPQELPMRAIHRGLKVNPPG